MCKAIMPDQAELCTHFKYPIETIHQVHGEQPL